MNKKLIAMISALTMSFSAVPFTANATEEPETLPEWIPQTFTEALHFDNKYGKTHIQDGLICCVRKKEIDERYVYTTEYSDDDSMDLLTLSSETYNFVMPEKPDKSDIEAYQEYLDFLNANYISESYVEYFGEVKPHFEYEVTVYGMNPSGSAEINWRRESADTGKVWETTTLSFESSADGEITETDIYGWFPDSIGEYISEPVSIINNHIVFCGNICTDGGYELMFEQTGTAKLECVAGTYLNGTIVTVPPAGGSNSIARAYKPLNAGKVKVTFKEAREWEQAGEEVSKIVKYYDVDDDGNITEIDGISDGDCNDDGQFTISDVVMLQKWLSGSGELTNWKNADFTCDNNVDVFDLVLMKQALIENLPKIRINVGSFSNDDKTILRKEVLERFPDTDMRDFSFVQNTSSPFSGEVFDVCYNGVKLYGYGQDLYFDGSIYASVDKRSDGLRVVKINLIKTPEEIKAVDTSVKHLTSVEMYRLLDKDAYEGPQLIIYVDYEESPVLAYRAEYRNGYGETIFDAVTGEKITDIPYVVY